jgi:hypothetical protein
MLEGDGFPAAELPLLWDTSGGGAGVSSGAHGVELSFAGPPLSAPHHASSNSERALCSGQGSGPRTDAGAAPSGTGRGAGGLEGWLDGGARVAGGAAARRHSSLVLNSMPPGAAEEGSLGAAESGAAVRGQRASWRALAGRARASGLAGRLPAGPTSLTCPPRAGRDAREPRQRRPRQWQPRRRPALVRATARHHAHVPRQGGAAARGAAWLQRGAGVADSGPHGARRTARRRSVRGRRGCCASRALSIAATAGAEGPATAAAAAWLACAVADRRGPSASGAAAVARSGGANAAAASAAAPAVLGNP